MVVRLSMDSTQTNETVTGIAEALAEIKRRGWQAVLDNNREETLTDDITLDPNTDDLSREYLVEVDTVTRMRDGYRAEVIWTRV